MQVTPSLGKEIRDYIKNLLQKDVMILNKDGICVSSSNGEHVNMAVPVPTSALQAAESQVITFQNAEHVVIPLRYQTTPVAALLIPQNGTDMQQYIPLIKSFAELLIQQYEVVNKPVLDSTDQFISKLLFSATTADIPMYESEATVLGYNLAEPRVAMAIHMENFWQNCLASEDQAGFEREEVIKDWKRKIEFKLSEFFSKHTDTITAYIGDDTFVVFKAVPEEDSDQFITLLKKSYISIFEPLKSISIKNIAVGLSNPYKGAQGLVDAYREAHLAVDFGERLWGMNKSYYFGDLGILSILGEGNREKEIQFAEQLLNKLTNEDLLQTLECFFDQNLNLTETAQHMGIHRNTVIYRLNQISAILGVDPRVFEQAMTIQIALLIKRLFG